MKNIKQYLYFLQEAITKQNIAYDLDKFKSGEYNKLLIMGLPGTGKTTASHYIERKLNIPVVHVDDCLNKTRKSVEKDNISPIDFWKMSYKKCAELDLKSNKKLIIDGIIYQWFYLIPSARSLIIKYPSIILNERIFKPKERERDVIKKTDIEGRFIVKMLKMYIKEKKKMTKSIEVFKNLSDIL